MEFNLFALHNREDVELRKCIRAYTISPKHARNPAEKNFKAEKIVRLLRQINSKLRKEIGLSWKNKWLKKLPFKVKKSSPKDWLLGRASIPLIAIIKLNEFGCEKEVNEIYANLDYFCTTTGTVIRIPKNISAELAWLVAATLCDGHIDKNKSRVTFNLTEKKLIKKIEVFFSYVFELKSCKYNVKEKPQSVKQLYGINEENKVVVRFLNKFLEIPAGKKCNIITVPEIIQQSHPEIKKAFLKGLFDTDGGKRRKGLGLTSASEKFRDQNFKLLQEFGIKPSKDEWINKLYNKKYYGLQFKIDPKSKFLCRSAGAENGPGLGE